jgi:hypothetical protein
MHSAEGILDKPFYFAHRDTAGGKHTARRIADTVNQKDTAIA